MKRAYRGGQSRDGPYVSKRQARSGEELECICDPPERNEGGEEVFGDEDCPVHFPEEER
jgi:hypothetical protein